MKRTEIVVVLMNKYESGVNYMDTEMIDLKALIQHLKNKLIFILLATLVAALALNIYGVRKANRSLENAEKQHIIQSLYTTFEPDSAIMLRNLRKLMLIFIRAF